MNSGAVIIYGKRVEWIRCPACGFGEATWPNGVVQTNQWAGDRDPDGRNVWAGHWQDVPSGCLLIAGEEDV